MFDVETDKEFPHSNNFKFIHSVGEKGMAYLLKLKKERTEQLKNVLKVVQIHQYFKEIDEIEPEYLVIPETTFQTDN